MEPLVAAAAAAIATAEAAEQVPFRAGVIASDILAALPSIRR